MNSVAGFKAVDAEGKELGIMSLADITAAVKESIMQDAAMARSVATLSEASTLAATDTYEDRLTQKTDLTWARGLDSNGNPILISKESLASVMGGLIGLATEKKRGLCEVWQSSRRLSIEANSNVLHESIPYGIYLISDEVFTGNCDLFELGNKSEGVKYLTNGLSSIINLEYDSTGLRITNKKNSTLYYSINKI